VDPKVIEKDYIYTGGGSEYSLVRIKSEILTKVNNGLTMRVRK
jgi:prolyl-tRNA editing enzyme YbaK/EbsC (Cys-tRNA(Pro) deacylase)